jgi:prophage regulatory protein
VKDRILRDAAVKEITGLSRTTRREMERRGTFPQRRRLGPGAVGWLESEVYDWLSAREKGALPPPEAALLGRTRNGKS